MGRRQIKSITYLLIIALSSWSAFGTTNIMVKDLKLYVDCEEFYIKAMCYNPEPLGRLVMNPDQTGGGGYCSEKLQPWGQTISNCFDSDYWCGSEDPDGPEGRGWFQELWERDFPLMKELGVNTLRLYNSNPTTREASQTYIGRNGISLPLGKTHTKFMDMAEEWGFKVIFPLMGDFTILTTADEETMQWYLRNQIDEVGNHPALLMYNYGNELDMADSTVELLNKYIDYIHFYQMEKWQRFIPVTKAVVDLPFYYDDLMRDLRVDVFSTNAGYRGLDFQDLWSGDRTPGFSGFYNLSRVYDKPVFIGELGWHQLDSEINRAIPDWFNQLYKDLVIHTDDGCIGGAFFEFNDEPGKADPLQQTMGLVEFSVKEENGRRSTDPGVFMADNVRRKEFIFDSVKEGTFEGVEWNYNSDVFELLGRPRSVLSPDECVAQPRDTNTQTTPSSTTSTPSTTEEEETETEDETSTNTNSNTNTNTQDTQPFEPVTPDEVSGSMQLQIIASVVLSTALVIFFFF